jgi:hypothetical protein
MATKTKADIKTDMRVTVRLKGDDPQIMAGLQRHYGADVSGVFRISIRELARQIKLKVAVSPVRP